MSADETVVLATNTGTTNGDHSPAGEVLAELREAFARQTADHYFDLPLPGLGGRLILRLGALGAKEATRLQERAQRLPQAERDFRMQADWLIAATRAVLLVPRDARRAPEPLVDAYGEPLGLDEQLGERLGLSEKTARGLLLRLFGGANDPELAIVMATGEYMQWAREEAAEVNEQLLGESRSGQS